MSWFKRSGGRVAPDGEAITTPGERAVEAWRALHDNCLFRIKDAFCALDGPARGSAGASLWPVSQVLAAAIDVAGLTGDQGPVGALLTGLKRYRIGGAYGPNPSVMTRYYDDNCWIALDLLRLHDRTRDPAHLAHVEEIFTFIAEGEGSEGGVFWVEEPKESLHTCSTAPAAQIALGLFRSTGDERYRSFAERCDAFLASRLRSPTGLYWDNIRTTGEVEPTHWSYNQGTPIGADVLWYELDGDVGRLDHAGVTARAALDFYGHDDGLWRQPAAFNGIFFRDLLALHNRRPDDRIVDALDSYLERAWTTARDPRTGMLLGGSIGRYDGGGTIDHAALVQLLALRAGLG
ncbi:MAG: hypothetical protein HYX32_00715 [Actinobacteria bacterium]|nr:hypothetical protein [Actinomycetota bacterium]